ncbi:MAG: chromosomal replication initiator protein DnaA [Aggregatilineales bacterium]
MNAHDAWSAAFHQLELQLDRATFDTWVRGAVLLGFEDGVFVIGVRNAYARDMLQHRLYRNVRRIISDIFGHPVELRFEVNKTQPANLEAAADMPLFRLMAQQPAVDERPAPLHKQIARPQRPDLPETELNARLTFDRFIAGDENATVVSAARAVADYPAAAYNPFFVYGGVGVGKTHLLQAIALECKTRGLRVTYIPAEVFTNDLVDAIRQRTTAMFREKYRSADVLLVDDIQFIAGKDSTQEEFFHTFNALYTFNKQIVLASDRHPRDLETLEARLRSRFEGGLVMDVLPPKLETRLAILTMWTQERGLDIPATTLALIAEKAQSNVRELEGIFNQMVAAQRHTAGHITPDIAEDILEGYHRPRFHITLAQVMEMTARQHSVSVSDLIGPRRTGVINQARQIAMYLARELTPASLPQIGEAFGGRKHSTVLHSYSRVAEDIARDPLLAAVVNDIRERLLKSRS